MIIHGKAHPVPVNTATQSLDLVIDDATIFFFPFKGIAKEFLPAQICLFDAFFFFEHLYHFGFCGDGSMIATWHPAGIETTHPGFPHQDILHSFIQRMAHV